ncbi:uncharacterized protein [Montipora foliosa]|uniref:uncharacterized protein n=1 Tax=Montipora foliosa TaxID=591990 RepID=UPI0035F1E33E
MSSFLPVGEQKQQEMEAIRNMLFAEERIQWPTVSNEPLNEYQTPFLATMAFPTLFPDGKADPTNQALLRDVPLHERIKHLLKFAENIDGKWVYRFASHPRFSYWAFNMLLRKRTLQQTGIFLKQNPGEAHLTVDELREMAENSDTTVFMSKISRYVGNTAGDKVHYRAKVVTKRNDPRLNNNQQLQLQGWRANCDIQVVIDYYACIEYLTKYAAKGEPRSPFLKKVFSSIVSNLHENVDSHKVIKKVVMKTVGERDYAAQETMHQLLCLKLHISSFNVIPVSLNGSWKISYVPSAENDGICTSNSLLDHYAYRDQYDNSAEVMNLNFIHFATKFKVVSSKLTKMPENIPKVFPTYSSNPRGPNFALYCKYQLLRYKPWLRTQSNAWGNVEATSEVLINCWQEFLQSPYGQNHVPQWLEKLEAIVLSQVEPDNNPFEHDINTREERMILSDLHTPFDNSEPNQESDRHHYTDQQMGEMPTWIRVMKDQNSNVTYQEYEVSDINSFSEMQRLAFNIVESHFTNNSPEQQPLHLIIIGLAGTGKSYLINAIRNLLQEKCQVSATTGKASYNVSGVTIHSLLKLPVGSKGCKDLIGQALCTLQENRNGIDYILIDEYSMLGQATFGWIDKRCKQATGSHDKILDGKSMILIGDTGQLPPVADKPLLLTRQPSNVSNLNEFEYATRLLYSNEQVAKYNHYQLNQLQHPVACINARHSSSSAKNASSDDMSGLEPVVFLAKTAKVMLTMNLWSHVGLCNGATGTVRHIIYDNGHRPPNLPLAVIVEFDNYRGPAFIDSQPSCVPICPVTVSLQSGSSLHERQQLPLRLAWALTIHKSQGLTLPKAWIDIGKTEKSPGITYVALSRINSFKVI